ncbi:uncharacterized protein BJ171DRAFT_199050 [Polychytrium aggregatum]|uniref:uncharacterized protein n=1 Tax=Polychytrium aggregatum TaxID=110093 RepID=UPI0022FEB07A|nr:uncharacterized protein BJ171DRAFT_199050 [Polychytrium aggregatum]KAI9199826.1 hypothetical protein BJ171DRAFT_199050 [Polychytrium aggregatum]
MASPLFPVALANPIPTPAPRPLSYPEQHPHSAFHHQHQGLRQSSPARLSTSTSPPLQQQQQQQQQPTLAQSPPYQVRVLPRPGSPNQPASSSTSSMPQRQASIHRPDLQLSSSPSPRQPQLWQPDEDAHQCRHCERRFTLFVRRHHCRWCGYIFCDACSSARISFPGQPSDLQHRVCDSCFLFLTGPEAVGSHDDDGDLGPPSTLNLTIGTPGRLRTAPSLQQVLSSSVSSIRRGIEGLLVRDDHNETDDDEPGDDRHAYGDGHGHAGAHESIDGRSLAASVMNECPVCQTPLDHASMGEDEIAQHINDCLTGASGGRKSVEIRGNRYLTQTLAEDIPNKECAICFDEFTAGQRIARLKCLCIYHADCIQSWFRTTAQKTGVATCPVHTL